MQGPSIAIIGAGASGLAAATRLLENGLTNLTIFEAENRIGGRINSVKIGDAFVDLGAQWSHGGKGNIAYELGKDDLGQPDVDYNRGKNFYVSNGRKIDRTLGNKIEEFYNEVLKSSDLENFPGTLGNYMDEIIMKELNGNLTKDKDFSQLILMAKEWYHTLIQNLSSAFSWYVLPTKNPYKTCEGQQLLHWKGKGYKDILDILMRGKEAALQEKILLDKEVSNIAWEYSEAPGVTITCSDGSTYKFDHVILTVSLGVLKAHHEKLFTPRLPPRKVDAIKHLSIGLMNKIVLVFPQRWWPENSDFCLLWTDEDREKTMKEFTVGPIRDKRSWVESLFTFMSTESHDKVLLSFLGGEVGVSVESLSDGDIMKGCMYVLRKFLGDKFNIVDPTEIRVSRWYSHPHFLGSYSYNSVQAENAGVTPKQLAEPLTSGSNKPVVLFAGEATSMSHHSTVYGAIETGWREVDRLITLHKKCR